MLFKDIIGLKDTKQALVRAVNHNHIAHAQLFDGGVGGASLAMALAFATYINCEDKQDDDACGRCSSCAKMSKFAHPDVHHIFPLPRSPKENEDLLAELTPQWRSFIQQNPYRTLTEWLEFINATANQQGILPIKEARSIVNKLTLKAFEGGYKIVILWQPELLNISAANALLKILEEPPAKTLFLFVTNNADKLLTTIISRTQRVRIRAFTDEEVCEYLLEKNVEEKRAKQIAYLSEGNLSQAFQLIDHPDDDRHSWFANWMRTSFRRDLVLLVKMADEFDGFTKEKQKGLFDYTLSLFRDLFLWQNGAESLLRLEEEELAFVKNFGKVIKTDALELLVHEITDAHYHLERNARAKILFLDLSLTAVRALRA